MKNFKGTAGKWNVKKDYFAPLDESQNANWICITNEKGETLADVKGNHYGIDNKECEANAALIEVAPKLLEACEEMLKYIDWKQPDANSDINLDLVRETLKRANNE